MVFTLVIVYCYKVQLVSSLHLLNWNSARDHCIPLMLITLLRNIWMNLTVPMAWHGHWTTLFSTLLIRCLEKFMLSTLICPLAVWVSIAYRYVLQ